VLSFAFSDAVKVFLIRSAVFAKSKILFSKGKKVNVPRRVKCQRYLHIISSFAHLAWFAYL
jgi:hypothetical protein